MSCGCNHEVEHRTVAANGPDAEDDDIWADEELRDTGAAAAKRSHSKQGYVDGVASAQSNSLQQGFDDGYPMGARLGLEAGEILGRLAARGDSRSKLAENELGIANVLATTHFDKDLNGGNHELLAAWRKRSEKEE